MPEDLLDYNTLLNDLFWSLTGKVKKNLFLCSDDVSELISGRAILWSTRGQFTNCGRRHGYFSNWAEFAQYLESVLKPIKCMGLNLFKVVELWKNYHPNVPVEYHSDVLYVKPSAEEWPKVKG